MNRGGVRVRTRPRERAAAAAAAAADAEEALERRAAVEGGGFGFGVGVRRSAEHRQHVGDASGRAERLGGDDPAGTAAAAHEPR